MRKQSQDSAYGMSWSLLGTPPLLIGLFFLARAQNWFVLSDRDFESALLGCLLVSTGVLAKVSGHGLESKANHFAQAFVAAGMLATFARIGQRDPWVTVAYVMFGLAYVASCYHCYLVRTGRLGPNDFAFTNPPEILTANRHKPRKAKRRKARTRARTAAR